jgi:hypothetical protein
MCKEKILAPIWQPRIKPKGKMEQEDQPPFCSSFSI